MRTTIIFFISLLMSISALAQEHTTKSMIQQSLPNGQYASQVLDTFHFYINRLEETPTIVEHIPGEIISYNVVSHNFAFSNAFLIQGKKMAEIQLKPSDELFLSTLNVMAPAGQRFTYGSKWGFGYVQEKNAEGVYTILNHTTLFQARESDLLEFDGPSTIYLQYTTKDFKHFLLRAYRWHPQEDWQRLK